LSSYDLVSHLLTTEFGVRSDRITPESTLTSLGLDSLSAAELVREIEREFEIVLSDEQASFETLGEAAVIIDDLVRADRA
jgi:acyl carrier protein